MSKIFESLWSSYEPIKSPDEYRIELHPGIVEHGIGNILIQRFDGWDASLDEVPIDDVIRRLKLALAVLIEKRRADGIVESE
jgi:hypothetical protein